MSERSQLVAEDDRLVCPHGREPDVNCQWCMGNLSRDLQALRKRIDEMQQPIGCATGDAAFARERADEAMRVARDAVEHVVRIQKRFEEKRRMLPEQRGCDARRCSKHIYNEFSVCEFCCLPMVDHLVFGGAR